MSLTRRQLLKWTATLSLAGTVASTVEVYSWWNTPPDAPFENLNLLEAEVVRSVAGAAFPSGDTIGLDGGDANMDRFFDTLLSAMTSENRVLLKLLLEAVDRATVPTHASHFINLSIVERQRCVEGWLLHDNALFRGAIQSLIVLLGMGYTAHPTASTHLRRYFRCGFGA